jgi:hypothetical protein
MADPRSTLEVTLARARRHRGDPSGRRYWRTCERLLHRAYLYRTPLPPPLIHGVQALRRDYLPEEYRDPLPWTLRDPDPIPPADWDVLHDLDVPDTREPAFDPWQTSAATPETADHGAHDEQLPGPQMHVSDDGLNMSVQAPAWLGTLADSSQRIEHHAVQVADELERCQYPYVEMARRAWAGLELLTVAAQGQPDTERAVAVQLVLVHGTFGWYDADLSDAENERTRLRTA